MGHKWTLNEKYPGMVPCAQSPVWMMSPLLHWLEKQTTFCCKMAHDVVPEEVKNVSGPFLPLCQLWFPLAGLHVSDFPEECALALEPLLAGIFIQIVLLTKLCPHSHPLGLILVVHLFIYLGFYVAFNTVQVISRWVVGRAEETSPYSLSGFCTVNCRPTASNYQLSHLRTCRELNPGLRGGRRECYHSATVAPFVVH